MTLVQLRNDPGQAVTSGADLVLDWFDHHPGSTIQRRGDLFSSLEPNPTLVDLLRVAGAIFCADRKILRGDSADAWTREVSLHAFVRDSAAWESVKVPLESALTFLTGDRWRLRFAENAHPIHDQFAFGVEGAVTLFSGGLDSLIGAIDLLENGDHVTLVGHHDSPFTDSKQKELFGHLRNEYGQDKVSLRRLYLRPAKRSDAQLLPLPNVHEPSSRSRSIVFIAAGLMVANATSPDTPLVMPENGYISINVPLTGARVSSLSTRTTHPYFMSLMAEVLEGLGIANRIHNPYGLMTKGEMFSQSRNVSLLNQLGSQSISCSHPELSRWRKRPPMNCGYCYPCLIRRAAFNAIGRDVASQYDIDVLTDAHILDGSLKSGQSTRALIANLNQPLDSMAPIRNGPLPEERLDDFADLYERGRGEMREWLITGSMEPPYAASRLI